MARYLRRNSGTEAPSNLIFVDTESYTEDRSDVLKKDAHKLRLWCAINVRLEKGQPTRRKEANGSTAEAFWQFVHDNSNSQRQTWIFAHNACYDLTLLRFWNELDEKRFVLTPMKSRRLGTDGQLQNSWIGKLCVESHPWYCQVRNGLRTYKFVDTVNYWQCKLEELGESVGIPKLKVDFAKCSLPELLTYCKRDVEIIEKAICQLIAMWIKEDCGVFKETAASLAIQNFRHTCRVVTSGGRTLDILCQPDSAKNALERESYFGGRIQAFFVGELHHKIYHLDCNSLYPYVMREYMYPRKYVETRHGVSIEELSAASKVYGVVARIKINSRYGCFPVRVGNLQYHCTGRFWTTLTGRELTRAIDSNCIDQIGTVQYYSVAPLFTDWVNTWYARKIGASGVDSTDNQTRNFCKLILNSLSGKWAQHGRHWKDRHDRKPLVRWGGYPSRESSGDAFERHRGIAGNLQVLEKGNDPAHSFPLISSAIAANAREYMRSVIDSLPDRSVYYMATDSLICNSEAYDSLLERGLISDKEIGKFKLVGTHRYGAIHGPNDYVLDSRQVVSGHIGKCRVDENGNLRAELWDRSPSIVAKGPTDSVVVTTVPAYYPHHTNRGRISVDGWWEPYRITDDVYFTDRPRKGSHFASYSLDTEADHIRPDV